MSMTMGPEFCDDCHDELEEGQIGLCEECQAKLASRKALHEASERIRAASREDLEVVVRMCYNAMYFDPELGRVDPDKETGADIRDDIFNALNFIGIECPDLE